jgi:hypothetical protein
MSTAAKRRITISDVMALVAVTAVSIVAARYMLSSSKAVFSVAAAWATLRLVGGWESEKGWIDRLGRLLGLYWIIYPILAWIVETVAAL